ncbi:hypothetical protein ACHQM5_020991 [Ranunculus cassubicifolius]
MASSASLLIFLSIISLFYPSISATQSTITLSLNHLTQNPFPDPWQTLTHFASASLSRAKHIKNPKTKELSKTPLFPQSYGAYSVSLSFGTPPQTIPFVMDTGSVLVWFPCTQRYLCKNCTSQNPNTKTPTFLPKMSSSVKLIGCRNPKCSWIHDSDVQSRCTDCEANSTICSQICPPYLVIYGFASTGGILISETLDLVEKKVPNFAVGCSLFASGAPSGIAGFGRGSVSLPSQLGLKKFSYCLVSHRFDDSTQSSPLVLTGGSDTSDTKTAGVSYTPFVKNPVTGKPAFKVYYYVGLKKITVGNKAVKIPYSYLSQGSDGNGGTIVDSGSTFTFMESRVFELVAREVEKQTTYKRVTEVEALTGLRPCFDLSTAKSILLPKLTLHFKGGADMELPLTNYFSLFGPNGVACMTIVTDGVIRTNFSGGPAVILGNFQMQNFFVEYDLDNQRFGFRQQICK